MEKELNLLSEKIEELEYTIEFIKEKSPKVWDDKIREMQEELDLYNNILNIITIASFKVEF